MGVGRRGEGGGSRVNKTPARAGEPPPINKTGPRCWRGRRPPGVHCPFLNAGFYIQRPQQRCSLCLCDSLGYKHKGNKLS